MTLKRLESIIEELRQRGITVTECYSNVTGTRTFEIVWPSGVKETAPDGKALQRLLYPF